MFGYICERFDGRYNKRELIDTQKHILDMREFEDSFKKDHI